LSKPTKKRPASISSLMSLMFKELMAIKTSLHMEPEAITNVGEDDIFLSQTDVWAKHADEHADAAWGLCDALAKRLVQIIDPMALSGRPVHLPHFKKSKKGGDNL